MFDRRLVPIILFGLAGSTLAAQDTSVTRLRRRADSLATEWRRADRLAWVADSLERERATGGRDTVAVGTLRIVANRSPLPLRDAAERAWVVVDSMYGPVGQRLATRPLFVQAFDPDTSAPRRVLRVGLEVPWNSTIDDLTRLLLANLPFEPLDHRLDNWLGGPLRPRTESSRDIARVYVQIVTAPSQSARRCFLGDVPSCRTALDLNESDSSDLQWYPSAAERRALLLRYFSDYFDRPATMTAWRDCLHGEDADCIRLIRSLPRSAVPQPLTSDAHRLLAHTALRIGGRGAYGRLLADSSATIGARLAAAAGLSLDSLLLRWHAEVLAARPTAVTLPRGGVPAALGWILLLAACGLRSSRWRVA